MLKVLELFAGIGGGGGVVPKIMEFKKKRADDQIHTKNN